MATIQVLTKYDSSNEIVRQTAQWVPLSTWNLPDTFGIKLGKKSYTEDGENIKYEIEATIEDVDNMNDEQMELAKASLDHMMAKPWEYLYESDIIEDYRVVE
jgi:hypothetical protein